MGRCDFVGRAALLCALALAAGCSDRALRDDALFDALDASAGASAPAAAAGRGATSAHAAYVAARQAEGRDDRRYHLALKGDALAGHNVAQGFGVAFDARGFDLKHERGGWGARFETRGLRCGTARLEVRASATRAVEGHPHRASIAHGLERGAFEEWAVNGPLGVEQGFAFPTDPCGGDADELVIEVRVDGLAPAQKGPAIALRDERGVTRARYGSAEAHDAAGRSLGVTLGVGSPGSVELRVAVANATWPVSVDPLIATQDQTLSVDDSASGSEFGAAMATDGTTAVIGAPAQDLGASAAQGAAYVFTTYTQSTYTYWALQSKLVASDGAAGDRFGTSVALGGTGLLVGARGGGNYVFARSGTSWIEQAKLTSALPATGANAAIAGTTALVGAPGEGAAYAFTRNGAAWGAGSKLTPSVASVPTRFGAAVSLSTDGTTALVGDEFAPVGGQPQQGAAYVFTGGGSAFAQQGQLIAATGAAFEGFGNAVALASPTTALVGAHNASVGAIYRAGAAYVFARNGATWATAPSESKLAASDAAANNSFGDTVAISGSLAIVGAAMQSAGDGHGTAYVFAQGGTGAWTEQQKLTTGSVVAIGGVKSALVGAPAGHIDVDQSSTGAVYVHEQQNGSTWTQTRGLDARERGSSSFGRAVALDGSRALVGAPGAAYVFETGGSSAYLRDKLTVAVGASGAFGNSVALGPSLAVIGASGEAVGSNLGQGAAYVFARMGTGWSPQQKLTAADGVALDAFGHSVALSGTTAIVARHLATAVPKDPCSQTQGAAYVFVQDGTSWTQQQKLTFPEGCYYAFQQQTSVAIDGDRALVGSSHGHSVFAFSRLGATWTLDQTLVGSGGNEGFGRAVALQGSTAVIGAGAKDDGTVTSAGVAYVFSYGGTTGWTEQKRVAASNAAQGDHFGWAVALSEQAMLVGAPHPTIDGYPQGAGAGYVFVRSGSKWTEEATVTDGAPAALFGRAVAMAGSRVLVGTPSASGAGASWGTASLYHLTGLAGWPCSGYSACANAYTCVDDVCCASACSGGCDVCSTAAGADVDGTCKVRAARSSGSPACPSNILCDGTGGECPTVCTSDALCPTGMYCTVAGTCVAQRVKGNACNLTTDCGAAQQGACRECATGLTCTDGVCCDTACGTASPCAACSSGLKQSGAGDGTCGPAKLGSAGRTSACAGSQLCDGASQSCPVACASDANCVSGTYCNATTHACVAKKPDGASACVGANECINGRCVDGYCCNATCSGLCQTCDGARSGSASLSGTCSPVKAATDPDNECPLEAAASCGHDGTCDGAATPSCAYHSVGTTCGTNVCSTDRTQPLPQTCVGANSCQTAATGTTCTAYKCVPASGQCGTSCATDGDCQGAFYCNASSQCVGKLGAGAVCSATTQCASGNCVDGYCCDTACSGACDACSATLKQSGAGSGVCGATKAGTTAAPVCAGSVLCNGTSTACLAACASDANCPSGSYCTSAGTCSTQKAQGAACNLAVDCKTTGACAECASGSCTDGVCCDVTCGGACEACTGALKQSGTLDGTCGPAKAGTAGSPGCSGGALCDGASVSCPGGCTSDASCPAGTYCSSAGSCATKKVQGAACNLASDCKVAGGCAECASGFCADGVCCNVGCGALCMGCSAGKTGGLDGTCAAITAGSDPDAECNVDATGTCGHDGACDGKASPACAYWSVGTSCGNNVCSSDRTQTLAQTCGGASSCLTAATGTTCTAYKCVAASGQCGTSCVADGECQSGFYCSAAGACVARLASGTSCSAAGQCSTGNCVDGFCCDTACAGACDACSATLKQSASASGTCGAAKAGAMGSPVCAGSVVCNGVSASCPASCVSDAGCPTGSYCTVAGTCSTQKVQGAACNLAADCKTTGTCAECASGNCVDAVCCDTSCGGACEACKASLKQSGTLDGTCGPAKAGTDGSPACSSGSLCDGASASCPGGCTSDASCPTGTYCATSGACATRRAQGAACDPASDCKVAGACAECASGYCVDAVCCDGACSGLCQACAGALKTAGGDGVCGSAKVSSDPHDQCAAEAQSSCGQNGSCNGSGACDVWAVGTSCASATCVGNESRPQQCTGPRTCAPVSGTPCGAYLCSATSGTCATACASDASCSTGNYCNAAGACVSKQAPGGACSRAAECALGNCVDGFCCDTACGGLCQACSSVKKGQGADGACGSIAAGDDPDNECTQDAKATCGQSGACNGSGVCATWSTGTDCGNGSNVCSGNLVVGKVCTGPGVCTNATSGVDCGAQRCVNGACAACTTAADCSNAALSYCGAGGQCLTRKAQGLACGADAECTGGHCVDGVCCDTACAGLCEACSAVKKGAPSDGVCGPVAASSDPDGDCAGELPSTCGQNGSCDGNRGCAVWAVGTSCAGAVCVGNESRPRTCAGSLSCAVSASGAACGAYACNVATGACQAACAADADCSSGSFCSGSRCVARLGAGSSCGGASACASGHCVDGVCCDTACAGLCEACSAVKKGGAGGDGVCGAVAASSDPDAECASELQSTCGQNGSCNGARACDVWPVGTVCAGSICVGNESRPRTCAGALSCAVSASGASCGAYACSAATGACQTACSSDGDCAGGSFCSGSQCLAKLDVGLACAGSNQCGRGNCVDGFCCDTACAGTCEACSALKKGLGADGVCGAIEVNFDPDNECAAQAQSTCGTNGQCDGSRACAYWANGTGCGAPSCVGNESRPSVCTAPGTCGKSASGAACGDFVCSTATGLCATTCSSDAECTTGSWCNGASHACETKQAAGAVCSSAAQCVTGNCVDGFCCDTACGGSCMACSSAKKGGGSDGACGAIAVQHDPDNECAQQPQTSCGTDGYCDGSGACAFWAVGTLCGSAAGTCNGNLLVGEVCQGPGVCAVSAGGVPCAPQSCSGGMCAACASAADCFSPSSAFCSAGACLTKKPAGGTCSDAVECSSGHCTDGFCCDTACGSACEACSAQKKGQGKDGECGAIASGNDPDGDCVEQLKSTCGLSGQCDGNRACAYWSVGTGCGSPTCVGNESRPSTCAGALSCAVSASGTSCGAYVCSAASGNCLTTCASKADCQPGNYCDATSHCVGVQAPGQPCGGGSECATGNCIDGYCCDTGCGGGCEACSAVKKGGGADGVCGAIGAGKDPDDECATSAATTCGTSGTCDGARACALYGPGQGCGADLCLGGAEVRQVCDGLGLCGVTQDNAVACAPYQCTGGHCLAGCAGDGDCVDGFFCKGGACTAKLTQGAVCAADRECGLGHCADGVCCNEACGGQCEACNALGHEGTCSVVTGSPVGSRKVCDGAGVCKGTCGGGDRTSCAYPDRATECALASCEGESLLNAAGCDGAGQCAPATHTPCGAYACGVGIDGGFACKSSCNNDTDCAGNLTCDPIKETCSQGGKTCSVDGASEIAPDGSEKSCGGYTCTPVTGCATLCDPQLQPCAKGYLCAQDKCVVASDDGGVPESATTAGSDTLNVDQSKGVCSVSTVGGAARGGGTRGAAVAAMMLALVASRRRRRAGHAAR